MSRRTRAAIALSLLYFIIRSKPPGESPEEQARLLATTGLAGGVVCSRCLRTGSEGTRRYLAAVGTSACRLNASSRRLGHGRTGTGIGRLGHDVSFREVVIAGNRQRDGRYSRQKTRSAAPVVKKEEKMQRFAFIEQTTRRFSITADWLSVVFA
jgi:hypothetical protein